MSANQPTAAWAGTGDPLVVVAGHLVSPQDGFGEIGRMPNGNLRRPSRIEVGTGGLHGQVQSVITRFAGTPQLILRTAEGSESTPLATIVARELDVLFQGFDGVGFQTGASLVGRAAENWAVGSQGMRLLFRTTSLGSVVLTNRWEMSSAGHLLTLADNVLDVGASGAGRPRDIHVGRTIVMGGGAVDNRGLAATGSDAFLSSVTGDGQPRFGLTADGRMRWGDGAAAPDTSLFRSAANILKTDDAFEIGTDVGLRLVNQVDGVAANAGTLANAPAAGDPVFWVPVHVNGSTRHFPVW